tara:strand:+ start:1765 stop:2304 length:540 start_codon:yes stop_codon:yes gene_type:complete
MIKKEVILFIILLFLIIYLLKKKNIEGFHNLIDPRYHTLSLYNGKDFYKRFMDYFHYGNIAKYDYHNPLQQSIYNQHSIYNQQSIYNRPHIYQNPLPTYPINIYDYPMNYIKSPIPIRTTIYEIQKINNPKDYSYQVIDKNGNLHLLDYNSDPKILTNENFNEQVWLNPHDKQVIFIPK